MSKENVLQSLNDLTIEQAQSLTLSTVGQNNNRITVVKTTNGDGYSGELSSIIDNYYSESFQNRQWINNNFYKKDIQSVGGQPDCPC